MHFKGNKSLIMNNNYHSWNSIKISRCFQRLDRTSAAMAMSPAGNVNFFTTSGLSES